MVAGAKIENDAKKRPYSDGHHDEQ